MEEEKKTQPKSASQIRKKQLAWEKKVKKTIVGLGLDSILKLEEWDQFHQVAGAWFNGKYEMMKSGELSEQHLEEYFNKIDVVIKDLGLGNRTVKWERKIICEKAKLWFFDKYERKVNAAAAVGGGESSGDKIVDAPDVVDAPAVEVFPCVPTPLHRHSQFPTYLDGDGISYYPKKFSLGEWLNHPATAKKLKRCRNGLPREHMAVFRSLIAGVIDFHGGDAGMPHGSLNIANNYRLTQNVIHVGGRRKVSFTTELVVPHNHRYDLDNWEHLKHKDMLDLYHILEPYIGGTELLDEFEYLTDLMCAYPFIGEPWKETLLRNYPALWDSEERSHFFVEFHYKLNSDKYLASGLLCALRHAYKIGTGPNFQTTYQNLFEWNLSDWMSDLQAGTVFYDIVYCNDDGSKKVGKPIYVHGDMRSLLQYNRNVCHHFSEKKSANVRGTRMDLRDVEFHLSEMFPGFLLAIYMGMCYSM